MEIVIQSQYVHAISLVYKRPLNTALMEIVIQTQYVHTISMVTKIQEKIQKW